MRAILGNVSYAGDLPQEDTQVRRKAAGHVPASGHSDRIGPPRGPSMQVLARVRHADRTYLLRGSFTIRFEYHDGLVIAKHDVLPVAGYGVTLREASDELAAMFDFQYREVHDVSDDELTDHARLVRSLFDRAVSAIA